MMKEQNWNAKEYAKHSKGQEVWARELIEKLDLKGSEHILDLGCGDGKVTNLLAQATKGKVVGVDKSEAMVILANESYPNIEFYQMDATALSFENEFDVIFSNAVLHWVHEHELVVQGLHRALKSNGKILLQFGGYGNAKEVLYVMDGFIAEYYSDYFKSFVFPYSFPSADVYVKLLREIGFGSVDVKLIPKDMVHENIEAFKGWIRTTWFPYLECLPESKRESFLEGFMGAYLDVVPLDEDGRVHVDMVRLEVYGSVVDQE
jgi:trans-aconitate methyltransferase